MTPNNFINLYWEHNERRFLRWIVSNNAGYADFEKFITLPFSSDFDDPTIEEMLEEQIDFLPRGYKSDLWFYLQEYFYSAVSATKRGIENEAI